MKSACLFVKLVVLCSAWLPGLILSQTVRWEGQASAWGLVNNTDSTNTQLATRYITGLSVSIDLGNSVTADTYVAGNAYFESRFDYDNRSRGTEDVAEVELHRCYARLTTTNVDLRIGLQRLNFGSAVLLRPLMWFDGLDPRDPMQFSKGVYGALMRVFFNNNANVWLWGLYGNDEIKGWELFPTQSERAEFGGRIQYPVYTGELAFTYHHREPDLSGLARPGLPAPTETLTEQRYAFDMRWDIVVGFWSEIVVVDRGTESPLNRWQRFINVGVDYSLGIGNGIGVTSEYFEIGEPAEPFGSSSPAQFVAGSVNYSLGIADIVRGVFYHDLERRESYSFLAWTHTLDNWEFSLNGFWNPPASTLNYDSGSMLNGRGLQITMTFNH